MIRKGMKTFFGCRLLALAGSQLRHRVLKKGQQSDHSRTVLVYVLKSISPRGEENTDNPSLSHCRAHWCCSCPVPAVSKQSLLSLSLRVPGQGLACDAAWWLPQGCVRSTPLAPVPHLPAHFHFSLTQALPKGIPAAPSSGIKYKNMNKNCQT